MNGDVADDGMFAAPQPATLDVLPAMKLENQYHVPTAALRRDPQKPERGNMAQTSPSEPLASGLSNETNTLRIIRGSLILMRDRGRLDGRQPHEIR